MDPENDRRYASFYLRRINRKLGWLLGILVLTGIIKGANWLLPTIKWVMAVIGGTAV